MQAKSDAGACMRQVARFRARHEAAISMVYQASERASEMGVAVNSQLTTLHVLSAPIGSHACFESRVFCAGRAKHAEAACAAVHRPPHSGMATFKHIP